MKLLLTACTVLSLACAPALGQGRAAGAAPSLGEVRKIFVGEMGDDVEAERFRLLVEEALEKEGFTVVGSAGEADAVLTGALSVRDYEEKSEARAFVRLFTPEGTRLWGRDFGHRRAVNPFSRKEPTKRRAEEIAEALHRDWSRAARATP